MMDITINFTPEAEALLRDAQNWSPRIMRAVAGAMDQQNWLTVAHIQETRLSGDKDEPPLPPELGILRHMTGELKRRTYATKAEVNGNVVESAIGTPVHYAAIHEFGGTITRRVQPGVARLRATAGGGLMRGPTGGAVFAKKKHKRVREVAYEGGGSYEIHIPARSPFQRGIRERMGDYEKAISEAAVNAVIHPQDTKP